MKWHGLNWSGFSLDRFFRQGRTDLQGAGASAISKSTVAVPRAQHFEGDYVGTGSPLE